MCYDNDKEQDVVWTNLAQVMNHNDNQISTSIKAGKCLASWAIVKPSKMVGSLVNCLANETQILVLLLSACT